MIKRSHIRQFLALVEAESFTEGASRIHVTQPTLSAGIADLERIVGAKLFIRNKRRVRLTETGQRFLATAQEIEQSFKVADRFGKKSINSWPDLRIGILKTLSSGTVEKIVERLLPVMTVELTEGSDAELRVMRSKEQLDLAITRTRDGDAALDQYHLTNEPYRMFVPDDHPLAGIECVSPEDLAGETMIARRNCEILRETSQFFTRHGVRPKFALKSESDDRCMRMVAAGVGITTAPISLAIEGTTPINVAGYDFARTIAILYSGSFSQTKARQEVEARLAGVEF